MALSNAQLASQLLSWDRDLEIGQGLVATSRHKECYLAKNRVKGSGATSHPLDKLLYLMNEILLK